MPSPRQSKIKKILAIKAFILVNIAILFLVTLSFGRELVRNYEIDQEISALEGKAIALESQNQEILELAAKLQTDDYLEQEGRMRLSLKKPGEHVAIIPEPGEGEPIPEYIENTAASGEEVVSNPKLWLEYFLDI